MKIFEILTNCQGHDRLIKVDLHTPDLYSLQQDMLSGPHAADIMECVLAIIVQHRCKQLHLCVNDFCAYFCACQELEVTTGPVVLSFRLGCLCPCSTPCCTCAVTETVPAFAGRYLEGYACSSLSQYADVC